MSRQQMAESDRHKTSDNSGRLPVEGSVWLQMRFVVFPRKESNTVDAKEMHCLVNQLHT